MTTETALLDPFAWSRVVVVDDTEASALLAQKVLQKHGLRRVETLQDPRRAVEWIAENDPDLVLLDLHMPHLDGYEVLSRIRDQASSTDLPVIVLTADATPDASHRALELDANDFLTKPLNAVELSHRVRTMLDMRAAHRRIRRHQDWLEAAERFSYDLVAGEMDQPLDRLASRAQELADAALVCVLPPGDLVPRARDHSGRSVPVPREVEAAVRRWRAEEKEPVLIGSMMVLPLTRTEGPDGVVVLRRDLDCAPFTTADLDDVTMFITRGSAAIELMERREERRRYLDFFHVLVSQVGEYAIVGLDEEGRVASWNEGAERVGGYRSEEVLGRHFSLFCLEEDREAGLPERLLEEAKRTGRAHRQGWALRSRGQRFWAESTISALHNDRGALLGFAVVTRDLTETKSLELARESFFASVSHDIRAPLTAIMGFTEMMAAAGPDRQDEFVQRVRNNVAQLGVMVDNMIDHARLQAGSVELTTEPLSLSALVEGCVRDLGPVLSTHRIEVSGDSVEVLADRLAFGRILANVLINAVRYSPAGSLVELAIFAEGSMGCVTVTDRGRGIEEADLATIFDEFVRGSRAEPDGGSGLGLSSVHRLVTLQNGTVEVRSSPGEGTAVTIALPRTS